MYRTRQLAVCLFCLIAVVVFAPSGIAATNPPLQTPPSRASATEPDEAHRRIADDLLQQIWTAQPGQPKFDAIDAVVGKYGQSDAATQNAIAWLCLTYMNDTSRGVLDRWPCCYVLVRAGYTEAVPQLIDVLLNDETEAMRAVAAESLGGVYKSTGNITIRDALAKAASTDTSKWVQETIARYLGKGTPIKPVPGRPGAPDEAHRKIADALLQQIWVAQPGQPKFDAIDAVVRKYKQSDVATKNAVAWLCLTYLNDTNRGVLDRWPCCYVLARAGYMQAVPDLIDVLLHNEVEAMRAVAAEALGGLYMDTGGTTIREALLKAARSDTSKWVLDTIARYLGKDMPGRSAKQPAN